MKVAYIRDKFKKVYKSVCTSAIVVSSIPSTSSAMKPTKNTLEGHGDSEPADEGYVQMEYSCD